MGKCSRAIRSGGSGAWCYWVLLGGASGALDSGEAGTKMWMNLLAANGNVHMPLYTYTVLWYALVGPCTRACSCGALDTKGGQVGSLSES